MKYLLKYKGVFEDLSNHFSNLMKLKYGNELLSQCDSIITDIKYMSLEIKDLGLNVIIGYTPMTLVARDDSPKIVISVIGDEHIFDENIDDINIFIDRVLDIVKPLGFSTDKGIWSKDNKKTLQILIQK